METFLYIVSGFLIAGTLIPLLPHGKWYIRGFDFIQAQVSFLTVCTLVVLLLLPSDRLHMILAMVLLGCFLYQFYFIFPYTPLARKQVLSKNGPGTSIKLFVSNVYMHNKDVGRCLEEIQHYQPDLILLLETNPWWSDQTSGLKVKYPYRVSYPLENTYGMLLYSKMKLSETEILFLVEDQAPSIHTMVELKPDLQIQLHCLHPAPPSPTENESAVERDAELLIVAKSVDTTRFPTIVMGDLNDVAWSQTTRLFQKVSGLLDPRIGRGFFNTFHVSYPFLRWPLDHIFHSNHFKLASIARVANIGSDHFPIFVDLCYDREAHEIQQEPQSATEDEELAREKINQALEK